MTEIEGSRKGRLEGWRQGGKEERGRNRGRVEGERDGGDREGGGFASNCNKSHIVMIMQKDF